MRGCIGYAGQSIEYRALHSKRKTLAISVHPDGLVEVVAPNGTAQSTIEERLQRRAAWIVQQRRYFEQFQPRTPERRFVSGEAHLYLGRQYRLKIEKGALDEVRLKGGYFRVTASGPASTESIAGLMGGWYRSHANEKLFERFKTMTERYARVPLTPPTLAIRSMQRRWGSYSGNGRITLNIDLVRAPIACIDYVIVHELAHGRHPNHGRAFFDLLTQMMPDWEKRKATMERMLA
ncbi:MAG: M48 family metallopeptidase [Hyphomicrobium sp.]|nr:M48 family metallopeptidase [Hyphomicrobium sp.]